MNAQTSPVITGLPDNLTSLASSIFLNNVDRGWWTRDEQGQVQARNVGELLCLIHSEIDEADSDGMDDKLPHRREFEVELADVVIRVLDMLGFYQTDVDAFHFPSLLHQIQSIGRDKWLMGMHKTTTAAMEAFRKGKPERGCGLLVDLLGQVEACAITFGLDLTGAIHEKLEFNANRADHKLENRRAKGGKSF